MASSSSVAPTRRKRGWTYDVFLSFRGEDTRNNFVDHLFVALQRAGIHTFKDDKMLGGGQPISQELMKAITESRFAVVVFSKNYANSSWCLEELSKIMECRNDQMGGHQMKVLPVFYHVDPSDVRGQKRDYAAAFERHEDKFKGGELDKVNKWRDALTAAAGLSGQHILPDHGGETASISKIVEEILVDKQPRGGSRENHLIGIQPRIDAIISKLKIEATEEVCIVGIWGMGGIGKTTIARALFKKIAHNFHGSSFVTNVRENSSSKKDMCALQQKILKDILGPSSGFEIHDPEDGADEIQERCCSKKILLVLDDVNDVKQLEFLAATREWFGPGSRIIITTRDRHLLSYANANDQYKHSLLSKDQAFELFSRHAFRTSSPPDGYMDLTNRAINYTHRLPLALKVVGSFLCGRETRVWESALDTLAKTPSVEVLDTLKLSFDYLNLFEKQIFLDIACFYKGEDVDKVTPILDSFGFDPVIGISVLVEKSLITISSNNTLDIHDLIQEMGWKVVHETSPNSRVWKHEEIQDFINTRELELMEGIVVPWRREVDLEYSMSDDVFKRMKNLRILDCYGKFTSCEPTFLPDELCWFCWREYPFSSLPLAHMRKLVGLILEEGKIKHLWQGKKIMLQNLKSINLQLCDRLIRFPDVSGAPNIESLNLSFCRNMVEVDESVGNLKKLLRLDMRCCWNLRRLPSILEMESLETLILSSCWSLEKIPKFSSCMVNLSFISFDQCYLIEEVPSSIKYLSNLTRLNLNWCRSLKNIPNSIWELKCLNTLGLSGCPKLPDDFKNMNSLEVLHLGFRKSINIHAFENFSPLRKLHLEGDFGDNDFPKNLDGLSSLEELHIRDNDKLIQLPESISHLSSLKLLMIRWCSRLQALHGLPPRIQVLTVEGCPSLERIEDLSEKYQCLYKIQIASCRKLLKNEENGKYLDKMLDQSFLMKWAAVDGCLSIHTPGSNFPSWFKEQQDGCKIALKLPPKWQTEIVGFFTCFVNSTRTLVTDPGLNVRFENDEMLVSKSGANNIHEMEKEEEEKEEEEFWNMWTGYIPYRLFEQFHGDNDNDFEGEDWFHMAEGNLVFEIPSYYYPRHVVRCAAKFIYKEDVTSIQQTIPSIPSFYWSWNLTNESTDSFKCSH